MSENNGNNIRQLRQDRGWSLAELAERIGEGTHLATVAKIERSMRKLTPDWKRRIARALEVAPEALETTSMQSVRFVPLIGQIAAGNWAEAIQSPEAMVPCVFGGPQTFALKPVGTSMNRIVAEGSLIFVDPDEIDLHEGRLYAVRNDQGEATFKRFRLTPARLEPVSDDPEHKPILIGGEPFTVIGRVVGMTASL